MRPGPDGGAFQGGDYVMVQPVFSGGERIGTFYIRTDRSEAWRRLKVNIATVGLVLLGAIGASLLLAGRLGGLVSDPVRRLARVVQTVSARRDYSVRVEGGGRDELGRLIEGFNDMLDQIQERDTALAAARDDLEHRVHERTRELQDEIAERRAAQSPSSRRRTRGSSRRRSSPASAAGSGCRPRGGSSGPRRCTASTACTRPRTAAASAISWGSPIPRTAAVSRRR